MGDTAAGLLTIGVLVAAPRRDHAPLGTYLANVFTDDQHWRVERLVYRLVRREPRPGAAVDRLRRRPSAPSRWSSFVLLFLVILAPGRLPLNHGESMHVDTALNTAVSFVTNTNWQSYAGEAGTSLFVQAVGPDRPELRLRGGRHRRGGRPRSGPRPAREPVHRQLLGRPDAGRRPGPPADRRRSRPSLLVLGGVIQNLAAPTDVTGVTGAAQSIPGGLVASQEAIKELGTNGGGFFNANSAHPFENPNALTNLFEIFLLLVIPFALPRAYGIMVGDRRQGYAILAFMTVLWGAQVALTTWAEVRASARWARWRARRPASAIWSSTLFAASHDRDLHRRRQLDARELQPARRRRRRCST